MNEEAIVIIRDIIKTELSLTDQNIWLFNQDYKIPVSEGLSVVLSSINKIPYANNNRFIENQTQTGINQLQYILVSEQIDIDLFSKNREAQTRQFEVIMAFNSYYSREQQEKYQFKIAQINQPFINISEVEGSGMLNRYKLSLTANTWQQKETAVDFYDNNFTPDILCEN